MLNILRGADNTFSTWTTKNLESFPHLIIREIAEFQDMGISFYI